MRLSHIYFILSEQGTDAWEFQPFEVPPAVFVMKYIQSGSLESPCPECHPDSVVPSAGIRPVRIPLQYQYDPIFCPPIHQRDEESVTINRSITYHSMYYDHRKDTFSQHRIQRVYVPFFIWKFGRGWRMFPHCSNDNT